MSVYMSISILYGMLVVFSVIIGSLYQIRFMRNNMSIHAHRYAIHFDILPQISYLNHELPIIISDLLALFQGFPEDVRISQQSIDEGIDFCRVVFWVFSDSSNALKSFGIWFQALFRDMQVANILERIVVCALDEADDITVELSDWTRVHALTTDVHKAVEKELEKNSIDR